MLINALPEEFLERRDYELGEALGYLAKAAGDAVPTYSMAGKLYVSKSGWGLLSVPNALVRGVFDALHEVGLELPPSGPNEQLNAHISVLRKDELDRIGGPEKLSERGHTFRFQLGNLKKCKPDGWDEMSEVYFLEVTSPELTKLRNSYGLGPPKHPYHVTVACRRKKITHNNDVKKAAGTGWFCETCLAAWPSEPPASKCPECSGDAEPDIHENRMQHDKAYRKKHKAAAEGVVDGCDQAWRDAHPGEYCPECHAVHERGDDGCCNRCGKRADCEPDLLNLFDRLLATTGEHGLMTVKPDRLAELLGHDKAERGAGGKLDGTFLKKFADLLEGGRADDMPDSDFDPEDLAKGIEEEKEHTADPAIRKEIAKDHLAEDPETYDES